jgi:LmbE family N-acetylglucosaminyl deacetylase
MIVVTPHLGDAVLSCGELLAAHPGAVVITLFAGIPPNAFVVPEWDSTCGFSSPRQAVSVRRREDRAALEVLQAEPCWLGCPDSQYRRTVSAEEVALRLARALRRHKPDVVAIPLGLVRGDHQLAHQAARRLLGHFRVQWLAYDDSPGYLPRLPVDLEPFPTARDSYGAYLKRRAAECHESLARGCLRAGREMRSLLDAPERYWRLTA